MQHRRICTVGIGLLYAAVFLSDALAKDWPQWGGQDGRNMVSEEKGLPESFVPGEKNPKGGGIDLATTKNVKWAAKLGTMSCSTPAVAGGKVFIGTASEGQGVLLCLDEQTGKPLWQLTCPPRDVPKVIDGRHGCQRGARPGERTIAGGFMLPLRWYATGPPDTTDLC